MLKLSDLQPLAIPQKLTYGESLEAALREFRSREGTDAAVDAAEDRREAARKFLAHAGDLVDGIVAPSRKGTPRRNFRVNYSSAPVRFGRTRLFLAKLIGRAVWRMGESL